MSSKYNVAECAAKHIHGRGQKIAFTNGVFDLLTPTHCLFLEWIKIKLIEITKWTPVTRQPEIFVGINSDNSVIRLKGLGRPIYDIISRIRIMESLAAVDAVFPFDEDTPEELIKAIKPDFLVKGGDYKNKIITGQEFVKSYGGQILISPLFDGLHTSDLIEKIRRGV